MSCARALQWPTCMGKPMQRDTTVGTPGHPALTGQLRFAPWFWDSRLSDLRCPACPTVPRVPKVVCVPLVGQPLGRKAFRGGARGERRSPHMKFREIQRPCW
jgi:hypothetical protein